MGQRMQRLNMWATELEMLAVASYFNTPIFEFTNSYPVGGPWKWIKIKPIKCHKQDHPFQTCQLHGAFYIHHTAGNHFDRIIPTLQEQFNTN